MKCPFCRNDNDRVIDTRSAIEGVAIRRRRFCMSCNRRFTTFERVEDAVLSVVKKDGSRVPFEREKIRTGLKKACWKRPVSDQQIERAVSAVENDLYDNFEDEVSSRDVGEFVMKHLAGLDQVAYVRFASVYREFKDVRDFVDELRPMLGRKSQDDPS